MKQPEEFQQGSPGYVCKLNKSLYGLKQSPRLWGEKLAGVLKTIGFTQLCSDPSLYIYEHNNVKVIMPVFVDDITLASTSQELLDELVAELSTHFKLRDLGPMSFLLVLEITCNWSKHKVYLS